MSSEYKLLTVELVGGLEEYLFKNLNRKWFSWELLARREVEGVWEKDYLQVDEEYFKLAESRRDIPQEEATLILFSL